MRDNWWQSAEKRALTSRQIDFDSGLCHENDCIAMHCIPEVIISTIVIPTIWDEEPQLMNLYTRLNPPTRNASIAAKERAWFA
jgi:hypothetical protein